MSTEDEQVKTRIYLGDGVYAEHDGYHVWLWTQRGLTAADIHRIALEPSVLLALKQYADALGMKWEK